MDASNISLIIVPDSGPYDNPICHIPTTIRSLVQEYAVANSLPIIRGHVNVVIAGKELYDDLAAIEELYDMYTSSEKYTISQNAFKESIDIRSRKQFFKMYTKALLVMNKYGWDTLLLPAVQNK